MKVRPGYGLEPLPTFTCTKYNQDRAGQISTQSAGTVWKEPVAVVTAKCNSDTSPPDVYIGEPAGSCLADDAANARGILKKNFFKDCSRLQQLGVTAFRAASGSVKEYLYVYDFGAEDTVQALELVGWSSGHWAEDGLNGDTAEFPHNDNVFKIAVSTTTPDQSVSCPQVQTPAGAEQREPCNRLDDGCSWTFSVPIKLRYLTLCVSSECNGCENYDFLSAIRVKTEVDNDNNNEPELKVAPEGQNVCVHNRAGLNDRSFAYCTIAKKLAITNNTLYVPPPCLALVPGHNHHRELSCSTRWQQYVKLPSNVVVGLQNAKCHNVDNPYSGFIHPRKITDTCKLPLACDEYMQVLRDLGIFVMIHVRRGDILKKFNNVKSTSIVAVVTGYMKKTLHVNHTVVAVGTDEVDAVYLSALKRELEIKSDKRVVMLDKKIAPLCSDNYCVFCNENQLATHAVVQMKFGHH